MPVLAVSNFNIVCAFLGGYISLFGLVSFLVKEKYYLSEALISLLIGVAFSEHGADFIRPLQYALGIERNLDAITLDFSRLVLDVQLVIAGIQLPSRYLRVERKSLALLLGPGMVGMWLISSLLMWGLVPGISFLQALAVGSCITPTDPILSNTIVKGKFADKNIPKSLQSIIIAESGANDGLGYPFLFFALYLLKFNGHDGAKGAGEAMRLWFGETWAYTILFSILYGAVVGLLAKELLKFCENRKYVDRESFIVFALSLALFIAGTCGMLGTDDVLASFIAGNAFTWDDWFRRETEDDTLQPTIDMLLNISVFIWLGAVCPWPSFRVNNVIPLWRLVVLAVLILCLRRLPVVFALHKWIHQIEHWRHAAFTGFFGPIGVSAIFYLYISIEFLEGVVVDGEVRPDAAHLQDIIRIVVWFMVISSIVVHGLSVPFGKGLGRFPKSLSQALSFDNRSQRNEDSNESRLPRWSRTPNEKGTPVRSPPQTPILKLGTSSSTKNSSERSGTQNDTAIEPPRPVYFSNTPMQSSATVSPTTSLHHSSSQVDPIAKESDEP